MIKFTLLHPSRWRAKQAREIYDLWMARAEKQMQIEHILSIDSDDNQLELYKQLFPDSKIIISDNDSVVQATNNAAKHANGEIIIYLSDDFHCPDYWDREIKHTYAEHDSPLKWLLRVDDQLQKRNADVLTIPIMTKKLMDHLGYFWHPEYKSMFVDQDLFWTCKLNGWLFYAINLKFPHMHYCNGKAPIDATYSRSNGNWESGQKLYNERRKQNFPLIN